MLKTDETQQETVFCPEVVLLEPEIPQNTGNIARTCAALGCPLHLIEPLGFSLENRYVRRAGMDYWHMVEVKTYPNIETFFQANPEGNVVFFTKKVQRSYDQANYRGEPISFSEKSPGGSPITLWPITLPTVSEFP